MSSSSRPGAKHLRSRQGFLTILTLLGLTLITSPARTTAYPQSTAPTLISPANGAQTSGDPNASSGYAKYPPLGIPTFVWSAVPGVTKYKLEVSTSPVFQPLLIDRENLAYTRYTPTLEGDVTSPGLTDHTLFYWRVSSWDSTTNTWSDPSGVWTFTRNWNVLPIMQAPTNGAVLAFTPQFQWTMVAGTEQYELQISTSPNFQNPTTYTTKQPYYTPPTALANDTDYYWRVRSDDKMNNPGDWSNGGTGWQLRVRWSYWGVDGERRPRPLTPSNLVTIKGMPLFSWTPVEGAQEYSIELNKDPGFIPNYKVWSIDTPSTFYVLPLDNSYTLNCSTTYYWRVRAKNADGQYGQWNSDTPSISYSFLTPPTGSAGCVNINSTWTPTATAPSLLYPLPYFDPSVNVGAFTDRTAPVPTFMWDQFPGTTTYTLEVDDTPVFSPPLWVTTTQNLNVTLDAPFEAGKDYYWRVRADPAGTYSDIWTTRVNTGLLGGATAAPPQLLRPTYKQEADQRTYGFESVKYWPSFEWLPVIGAAQYRIQIAQYGDMTGVVDDHVTHLTNYTPATRYASGTYYWHVCALDAGGNCSGGWSSTYRFLVASQVQIALIGDNSTNDFPARSLLAADPSGDAPAGGFDLQALYAAVGRSAGGTDIWYLGLQTGAPISAPVRYGIYVDKNHAECINAPSSCDSGATSDPLGMQLQVTSPHRPEYALYLDLNGGLVTTTTLYTWTGTAWGPGILLSNLAGAAYYNTTTGFIKLELPFAAIGNPPSISLVAFSANPVTGQAAQDTVPSNTSLSNLVSFVTDSMAPSPVLPPNNPVESSARVSYPTVPLFAWHTFDNAWSYRIQVALDYGFSNIYRNQQGWVPNTMAYDQTNPYYASQLAYADNNTYYWRAALVYSNPRSTNVPVLGQFGPYSQFTKAALVPQNLVLTPQTISGTTTYTWRTPTLAWDAAEAASQYRVRVYPSGSSSYNFSVETSQTNYTWTDTLNDGAYSWTVEAKDADGNYSTAFATGWFTKVYSGVVPVYPITPTMTLNPVEFRWQPVNTAMRYELQIARDPNFSSQLSDYYTSNSTFTPEQTPTALKTPGDFYWRVRLVDGSGHYGPWVSLFIPTAAHKLFFPMAQRK